MYNNEIGKEQNSQLFFSGEFGFKINRFYISVNFKNILDKQYFLYEENNINGYSTGLKINWSFIN